MQHHCKLGTANQELIMSDRVPMTAEGAKRLAEELRDLIQVKRPEIIVAIAEARAHGDLSENAEYTSAKERQGFLEARIAELESMSARIEIIDPAKLNLDGRCIFGSFVEIQKNSKDGENQKQTYQVVSEYEANLDDQKISITSPIGKSLVGKYSGDVVTVQTPGGEVVYNILNVRYQ